MASAGNNIGRWSAQASLDAASFVDGVERVIAAAKKAGKDVPKAMADASRSAAPAPSAKDWEDRLGLGNIGASLRVAGGLRIGMSALGTALGGFVGMALVGKINQTVGEAENFGALNDQLGTSIEFLSTLRTVAGESGVNATTFGTSMERLNMTIGAASQGSAEARGSFERLGLSWADLAHGNRDQQLLRIADAFGKIENRSERARLSQELFGRGGGAQMLRVMNSDLGRMLGDAGARGGTTTAEQQAAMMAIDTSIDRMSTQWTNTWRTFVASTAPAVTAMFGAWERSTTRIGGVWRSLTGPGESAAPIRPDPQIGTVTEIAASLPALEAANAMAAARSVAARAELRQATLSIYNASHGANAGGFLAPIGIGRSEAHTAALARMDTAMTNLHRTLNGALAPATALAAAHSALASAQSAAAAAHRELAISTHVDELARDNAAYAALESAATTPMEAFSREMARLGDLFDRNVIGAELMSRSTQRAFDALAGAATPLEQFRRSITDMMGTAGLTDLQRGRLIDRAASGFGNQAPQLLGALDANTAEVGAILQAQSNPQTERLDEILAEIRAAREVAEETRRLQEQLGQNAAAIATALAG